MSSEMYRQLQSEASKKQQDLKETETEETGIR